MFERVKGQRVSEEIAAQIRQTILSGRLKPEDRLPPENELAELFGTARTSVREALRSLEAAGLIVVKRGARGGPYVGSKSLEQVGESLSDALRLGASIGELTEARLILEPALARLAAERADADDLKKIRRAIEAVEEALGSGINPGLENLDFHRAVASASKNFLLVLTLNSAIVALAEVAEKLNLPMRLREQIANSHRRIYQALERRDPGEASRLMERHILEMHKKLWGIYIHKRASTRGQD